MNKFGKLRQDSSLLHQNSQNSHLCTDTDGTMMDDQSHSDGTDEESAGSRIKICWFEEFSRLANADRPDDMKTFTYLEDF